MTDRIPKEIEIRGIYVPPLLLSVSLGLGLAWLSCLALYRLRLDHNIGQPTVFFLALSVVYAVLLSTFVFPS